MWEEVDREKERLEKRAESKNVKSREISNAPENEKSSQILKNQENQHKFDAYRSRTFVQIDVIDVRIE